MTEIKTYPAKTAADFVATTELGGNAWGGLEGKLAIVTGASNGLGRETARVLAKHGAHVVMPVRNAAMGGEVADAINAECKAGGSAGRADLRSMDLGSLASIRAFVKDIEPLVKEKGGIDFLICNAGIMAVRKREETVDGFESQIGTNHIGHSYLVLLLGPHLKHASRVVAVSSLGHRRSGVVFDDPMLLKAYDPWKAYGQSKSANILMALQLQQILGPRGISAFSLHPGAIFTGLQKHMTREEEIAMGWYKEDGKTPIDIFKDVPQGASTTIYAALHRPLAAKGGSYLEDCHVAETTPPSRFSKEDAAKLWGLTLGWLNEKGFGDYDQAFWAGNAKM